MLCELPKEGTLPCRLYATRPAASAATHVPTQHSCSLLQQILVITCFHTLHISFASVVITTALYYFFERLRLYITLFLIAYFLFTCRGDELSGLHSEWRLFTCLRLWSYIFDDYFPIQCLREGEAPPAEQAAIFGLHPHGCTAFARAALSLGTGKFHDLYPGRDHSVLAATVLFYIPLARNLLSWVGGCDANTRTAMNVLQSGRSLMVMPGGEREQLLQQSLHRQRLFLRQRKGFVRLALRTGARLVPVYVFGICGIFTTFSMFDEARSWLQRTFKVAVPFFYGRLGPLAPHFVPNRVPVVAVFGRPIDDDDIRGDHSLAFEEKVDAMHARYVDSICQLFERHKGKCAEGDEARLEIL